MKVRWQSSKQQEGSKLSSEEEMFIAQLEYDKEFELQVFRIRRIFDIPENGLPTKKIEKKHYDNVKSRFLHKTSIIEREHEREYYRLIGVSDDLDLLKYYSKSIYETFNLPDTWEGSFSCFLIYGILPLLPKMNLISYFGRGKLFQRRIIDVYKTNKTLNLIIVLESRYSKEQLHKWIDSEWAKGLGKEVGMLPKNPESHVELLKVYKRIFELKEKGYSNPKIAELLEKEHLGRYGYESIRSMYNRHKAYMSSLRVSK